MKAINLFVDSVPNWCGNDWTFAVKPEASVVPDEDFQEYLDRFSRHLNQRWSQGPYYFCEHCHTVHLRYEMTEVKHDFGEDDYFYLCHDCLEEAFDNDEVIKCDDCGVVWTNDVDDHIRWIDNLERQVCGICADNYSQCCYCNNWFPTDDMTYINGREEYACRECGTDRGRWGFCDSCQEAYDEDDLHYDEDDGCAYCESCWEEHFDYRSGVVDYSACHNDSNQLPVKCCPDEDERTVRCCGVELEYKHPDGDSSADDLFYKFDHASLIGLVKVTRDGTVDGEVVTAPMSLRWLYKEPCDLEEVTQIMKKFGCTSWRETLVGGHIHVSDYGLAYSDKKFIARLVNACADFFRVISGRTRSEGAFDYCHFEQANCEGDYRAEHGCAVNIHTHYPTIEFRFWGGTLNFPSIRARASLCVLLVEYCASIMDEESWEDMFPRPDDGDYNCREYIAKYYNLLLGFFESLVKDSPLGSSVLRWCADRAKMDREKWFCCEESDVVFDYLKEFETPEEEW